MTEFEKRITNELSAISREIVGDGSIENPGIRIRIDRLEQSHIKARDDRATQLKPLRKILVAAYVGIGGAAGAWLWTAITAYLHSPAAK